MFTFIALLISSTNLSVCDLDNVKEKLPIYVDSVQWNTKSNSIVMGFKPFSLGFEGGNSYKSSEVELVISESYKYHDTTTIKGIKWSFFMEHKFLADCSDYLILEFKSIVSKGNEKQSINEIYKIKKSIQNNKK